MCKMSLAAFLCALATMAGAQNAPAPAGADPATAQPPAYARALTPDAVLGPYDGQTLTQQRETSGPLTLQAAIDLALGANAVLSAAAREVNALEGPVIQGGLRPNPEAGIAVEDLRDRNRITTLQLSQRVERGDKREARISAAERGRDVARSQFFALRNEVRADTVAAFFAVLGGQEAVRLAQASVGVALRATDAAQKRVLAGKVSPVEETRARLAEAAARAEATQAASDLLAARKRLASLWGNPSPRFEAAVGDLETPPAQPPLDALLTRLDTAPALARARLEIDRRQALAGVERSRAVQDVTFSAGVRRNEELGLNQFVFGASIPLPVNDHNQGNLLEAVRRTDQSRDEFTATRIQLSNTLAQAHERLGAARALALTVRQDILPGAQSAFDAATRGFELGKFNFLDVLDAQRTLFQARSQYVRALADAHRAVADIERIVGGPADQELQ